MTKRRYTNPAPRLGWKHLYLSREERFRRAPRVGKRHPEGHACEGCGHHVCSCNDSLAAGSELGPSVEPAPEQPVAGGSLPPWFRVGQRVRLSDGKGIYGSVYVIKQVCEDKAIISWKGTLQSRGWRPSELAPVDEPDTSAPAARLPDLPAGCEWRACVLFDDCPDVVDQDGERLAFAAATSSGASYYPLPLADAYTQRYATVYDALAVALGHPQEAGEARGRWLRERGWNTHDWLSYRGVARDFKTLHAETFGGRDLEHEARVLAAERERKTHLCEMEALRSQGVNVLDSWSSTCACARCQKRAAEVAERERGGAR